MLASASTVYGVAGFVFTGVVMLAIAMLEWSDRLRDRGASVRAFAVGAAAVALLLSLLVAAVHGIATVIGRVL